MINPGGLEPIDNRRLRYSQVVKAVKVIGQEFEGSHFFYFRCGLVIGFANQFVKVLRVTSVLGA